MPTTAQLRERLGLPRNTKTRQVLNYAIRQTPGGNDLLNELEKVDWMRVQFPDNGAIAAKLVRLRAKRNALAESIKAGA